MLTRLPDELAGQAIKSVIGFFDTGELPPEDADLALGLIFDSFFSTIQRDREKYQETCARNRRNRQGRTAEPDENDDEEPPSQQPSNAGGFDFSALIDRKRTQIQQERAAQG